MNAVCGATQLQENGIYFAVMVDIYGPEYLKDKKALKLLIHIPHQMND